MKSYFDVKPIIVSSPYDFPIIGTDIVAGTSAQVSLMAQVTYATPQVRDLSAARRGCLFHDEGEALGFREYRHSNCIAQCHRDSTVQHCNCTPFFYPNDEGIPLLTADVFNYEMPDDDNPFFDDEQDGMQCSCAADCERLEYTSEIYVTPMTGSTRASEDYVQLDIHFKQPAMVKYRTDVVFGWLDLTVSLGGIAGLFLGFSLLSGAEFIYFLTFRMFGLWKQERSKTRYTQQVTPFHIFQQRSNQLHKSDYTDKSIKRILPQPYY
ncbi:hypothetical protein ANN_02371 [Periplaneta americana]|uniref:Uncharacterized protein n=1 Tax=Periplaneta americana TaxID=6978 RepID=A0ABQ8TXR2_PERAM|nr:hypothetical protein ANN_02371 [Periplaneta americana]